MKDLKSILKSFYLLSGMNMTIFDIHQNVVVSYPDKKCPLCYLLDQYKDARNKCTKCDKIGRASCRERVCQYV